MTRENYNQIAAFNNSFLSNVKRVLMGEPMFTGNRACDLGTAFHSHVLESKPLPADVTDAERRMLEGMATAVQPLAGQLINRYSKIETVKQWTDAETGLPCKGILDIHQSGRRHVVDLKTSGCAGPHDFNEAIKRYEYDRAAAFYLDAVGADSFTWLCVSKRKPYYVWVKSVRWNDPMIEAGRRKYRFLLRKCVEMGITPGATRGEIETAAGMYHQLSNEIEELEAKIDQAEAAI